MLILTYCPRLFIDYWGEKEEILWRKGCEGWGQGVAFVLSL